MQPLLGVLVWRPCSCALAWTVFCSLIVQLPWVAEAAQSCSPAPFLLLFQGSARTLHVCREHCPLCFQGTPGPSLQLPVTGTPVPGTTQMVWSWRGRWGSVARAASHTLHNPCLPELLCWEFEFAAFGPHSNTAFSAQAGYQIKVI